MFLFLILSNHKSDLIRWLRYGVRIPKQLKKLNFLLYNIEERAKNIDPELILKIKLNSQTATELF